MARMRRRFVVGVTAAATVALLWAVGNTLYVYLVLGGSRTFRVESAVFWLVATLLPLAWWTPTDRQSPAALSGRECAWLASFAAALWLLALIPFLNLPFLSDDYVFLASYRSLRDVVTVQQFLRPMFGAVFLLLATVAGGDPWPFHVAGLLLHATSAWLVYVLARRFFQRTDAAVFCLAVFLLNPLQAEAVLWASGLQDLLWAGFLLAAIVVYTGARPLTASRLGLALLLVVCSLLSKETAVSFVLLLPLADWAFFRMKRGSLQAPAYLAFLLTLGAYLAVRSRVVSIDAAFFVAPSRYFVQKFLSTPYKFFVQPWNAEVANASPVLACSVTLIALIALFWAVTRGVGRTALLGPAVVLASTLPVYAYFHVSSDLQATRYLYFASVGWALLTAHILKSLPVRRLSFALTFASIAVASFLSLQANLAPWRTAAEIVREVTATIQSGRPVEARAAEFRRRYGEGLEIRDGVPAVYKGVYLFVNGYPELRTMLTTGRTR